MNSPPSEEYKLIRRLQAILPPADPRSPYELAIGDDAAVRLNSIAGERLVVTADVSVENVHFSTDTTTFEEIGYKSMVSNLSDCAAMGARPDGAVVQIVFPKNIGDGNGNHINTYINNGINNNTVGKGVDSGINTYINNNDGGRGVNNPGNGVGGAIEQIYAGFSKACARWGFPIVGGDLSGGGEWTIGITLIGSVPPGGRLLRRTGIADGDALWVTGAPGESAAGLAAIRRWGRGSVPPRYKRFVNAHVTPAPAIDEGTALAADPSVHAMMDLSDGLSKDIAALCFDNRLGFVFDPNAETTATPAMIDLADDLRADFRDWFYHGGEEYELLFACDPSFDPRSIGIINENKPNLTRLGRFTSTTRKVLLGDGVNGGGEELPMKSWDHIKGA